MRDPQVPIAEEKEKDISKIKPVLIVEDEAIMRESLRDWLKNEGYEVETAEQGEEALHRIGEVDFGVLVLDLRLPGKDGLEVLKEARAQRPQLKGIIITAYPSVETAVEAMKLGALDYLPKPFAPDALEKLIRETLGPVQVAIRPKTAAETATVVLAEVEEVKEEEERARVEEVIDEATGKVYLPPCQIACPIGEPIQRTNVMIAHLPLDAGEAYSQIIKTGDEIYEKNPLFTVCSYVCGLCELECNYKDQTGAIRRKMLKRFLTDHYLSYLEAKPPLPHPAGERVAVIGGGPGGLMCAYTLGKKGYQATILERDSQMGGALRQIPRYRLPQDVLDTTLNNLVRIAHIQVKFGVNMGNGGKRLGELKDEGYRAVFIATGTPTSRQLTFEREMVAGTDLEGVMFGLDLLRDANKGQVSSGLLVGKRVIVIGGGNVAFDVARTARRLGGDVSLVCLEREDKSSKDGIPADMEEIEGATEEGIGITYSRGIEEIIGEGGKFEKIKCPRCTSVFDESGFNPQFDRSDTIYLEGDVLLVTIGQGPERAFYQQEGLLEERGRLDVDQLTLMSNLKEGVFIGGDVKRIGFAAEAMRDGVIAAESIDRYLKGEDLKAGREKGYEGAPIPQRIDYKPQPKLKWAPAAVRLNFEPFEKGFTLEEAVEEAKRCLYCGPCQSCKACVALELQPEIPQIEVNQDICSGCGLCVAVCSYAAVRVERSGEGLVAVIDDLKCKRCGVCASVCPSEAITIKDGLMEAIDDAYSWIGGQQMELELEMPGKCGKCGSKNAVYKKGRYAYYVSCPDCGYDEEWSDSGLERYGYVAIYTEKERDVSKMKPVLVVEDEAIMRESLRDWLKNEGYEVETAEQGEEALHRIGEVDFGVLVLDLRLPGKDGLEVLKEARAKRPQLKGIIITAYPSVETAVEAMKIGAVDYLPKPFAPDALEKLIRETLGPVQVEIKPKTAIKGSHSGSPRR